ncbi:SPOR domain-containing protein [Nocardioides sp.]|uniref:SPOR domain-containing protein n=1 Tax=Nocardioides sp. TaxID=35761 RepID=UPI002734712B|nr:hypothetical protein [Nocardioides sp.]MDP3893737.1 hypothetical protein [Nocardioides sp.]
MNRRTPPLALALASLALLGNLGLTACSSEGIAEKATERALEKAAEGGADVDIDSEAGEVTIKTDQGTFSTSGKLPANFPAADLPLVDGEVLTAASSDAEGSRGWMVMLSTDLSTEAAAEQARQKLLDAGFATEGEDTGMSNSDAIFDVRQYVKDPYSVTFSAFGADDGASVNYLITVK